jgi:hypothetical protein
MSYTNGAENMFIQAAFPNKTAKQLKEKIRAVQGLPSHVKHAHFHNLI